MTKIRPSAQFLAACRLVLGDDSPATVLAVMRSTDPELIARLRCAHADNVDAETPTMEGSDDQKPLKW